MGNGSGRIAVDTETSSLVDESGSTLDIDMIEKAAAAMAANFGQPNQIFISSSMIKSFLHVSGGGSWSINPEYTGTPWAETARLTKRERTVAGLHTTLAKLGVMKKISTEEFECMRILSIKRLKRAKWARYQ